MDKLSFEDGQWWAIETVFQYDDMSSIELLKQSNIQYDEAVELAKKSNLHYPQIIKFFEEFKVWKKTVKHSIESVSQEKTS